MKQIPLPIGFETEPTFDDVIPGENALALTCLRQMALPGPPVYLCGPAGSGKTYLLAALAHDVRHAGGRTGWFDAEAPLPWEFDEGWSLIVIDGAERLDAAHQHAAFRLFIEASTAGIQMASAGRQPPVSLNVREDLRTRFGWGPVFMLQPLSDAGMRYALDREAQRQGLTLPDEVLDYLLGHFERDLSKLMDVLHRLDRFALARKRPATVPLLKRMLAEEQQDGWDESRPL